MCETRLVGFHKAIICYCYVPEQFLSSGQRLPFPLRTLRALLGWSEYRNMCSHNVQPAA